MTVIQINNFEEFVNKAQESYMNGPESLIIGISNDINIWTNKGSILTLKSKNYKQTIIDYLGGTIINFPGDLNLLLTTYGDSSFGENSLNLINNYLYSKGISSYIAGNDLMIDDNKVASYTKRAHLNGWYQNIIHFSINTDIGLVQSICTKQSNKIPGKLSQYNINSDILLMQLQSLIEGL